MSSRIAVVTGAARGIGLALTAAFADRGDTVIATVRNPDHLTDLAAVVARRPAPGHIHASTTRASQSAIIARR